MSNETTGLTFHSLLDSLELSKEMLMPAEPSAQGGDIAQIPAATYRIQFNKTFTFRDGVALIPYLKALGVSHVYASPILEARPGSMHGYDLISHSRINPEIGGIRDFIRFSRKLREEGLKLIVDIVPNHMGVGKTNPWWMDVLENGPASAYAEYFDIDWRPVKQELHGKVVIPILGDTYGNTLTSGQLKLVFSKEKGAISFQYYEHELPLNPVSYPDVLSYRLDALKDELGEDNTDLHEFQSILSAFSHLPGHMEPSGFNVRIAEKTLQMRRLADLCQRNKDIVDFIEENLRLYSASNNTDVSAIERLHGLLEKQAYRLVFWRVANDEINYRRFFDVNDLAALRTEDPRVFADMHKLIFQLIEHDLIHGLRIDHPDGLFDPYQYFIDLQREAASRLGVSFDEKSKALPFYILVEKILAPFEKLEESWSVHGTTGYDFMNEMLSVLVVPENDGEFTRIYEQFVGEKCSYEEMKVECKHTILSMVLASELNMLAHRISEVAESSWFFRDITLNALRNALREILLHFPVYRTYVRAGVVDRSAIQFIDWAISQAKKNDKVARPFVYDFIRSALLLEVQQSPMAIGRASETEFKRAAGTFAMKFQQFSGPVMAKSVEDTLFYRYSRFVALNEVGGEPEKFASSAAAFHKRNQQRAQRQPYSMLASSTHDTKRSEDCRARLAVLSEIPAEWEKRVQLWARMNRSKKVENQTGTIPDPHFEYFLYQTLVASFPLDIRGERDVQLYRERITSYALKAAKEAKLYTSWINQNNEYEDKITQFVIDILTPGPNNAFLADLQKFVSKIARFGLHNSLLQTILKLTCPGVPDFYQGTEFWDFSLVDPDNRRPVDFDQRFELLRTLGEQDEHKAWELLENAGDGKIKLFVSKVLLQLRGDEDGPLFGGDYVPIPINGERSKHLISFARKGKNGKILLITLPRFLANLISPSFDGDVCSNPLSLNFSELAEKSAWCDCRIVLPSELAGLKFRDLFTNDIVLPSEAEQSDGGGLEAVVYPQNLFAQYPFSVLISETE